MSPHPTVAGIVSLLNDALLGNGKQPLGFLNPLLYKTAVEKAGALNDITSGNNPGCGTEGFNVCKPGFVLRFWKLILVSVVLLQATTGWDPVTGLGTPNFGILKDLVLKTKAGKS